MKMNLLFVLSLVVAVALAAIGVAVLAAAASSAPAATPAGAKHRGQVLYNGIRLPAVWPPRARKLSREPVTPPYLKQPPDVINMDVGRQLLVDDFLIEKTTCKRSFHLPTYHRGNPVVTYDRPWEKQGRAPFVWLVWPKPYTIHPVGHMSSM